MELPGVARQFRLQLGFEGPEGLSVTGEFVRGVNVLGSAAAGGARGGRIEHKVQAPCEPSDLRLLLNRIGLLIFQIGFQPGDFISDQGYCVGRGSASFEDFEEVLVAEDRSEVSDLTRGEECRSLAISCGDSLNEVESAWVEAYLGHGRVFRAHVFRTRSKATQPSVTAWPVSCLKIGSG